MNRTFEKYKWINLMTFAVMYNFVYLGRFNINNLMNYIAGDLVLTDGQQEAISMSVFISYALGSFINGYLADRFGAKKIVVIGGLFTCVFNVCVPFQDNWTSVLLIWFLNGYFQSMIWVGGISFLSNWWQTGERGKGIGVANFFSGMSHATAYVLPVMVMPIWPAMGWKISFIIPIGVLFLFVVLFAIFARETPESTGLEPYIIENVRYRQREEDLTKIAQNGRLPWSTLFRQSKFCWWCMIAMLSSICRYGLLNWIPLYYDNEIGGTLLSNCGNGIRDIGDNLVCRNQDAGKQGDYSYCYGCSMWYTDNSVSDDRQYTVCTYRNIFRGVHSVWHQRNSVGTCYRSGMQSVCGKCCRYPEWICISGSMYRRLLISFCNESVRKLYYSICGNGNAVYPDGHMRYGHKQKEYNR